MLFLNVLQVIKTYKDKCCCVVCTALFLRLELIDTAEWGVSVAPEEFIIFYGNYLIYLHF